MACPNHGCLSGLCQIRLNRQRKYRFGELSLLHNDDAVQRAAEKSGADILAATLPASYDSMLGKIYDEQGQDISIGQWQKLALARAYMREAAVLVLDEPTAALDARAEVDVYRQFSQLSAGKSVLLISHRLGSARLADRIIVLENGRIIEQGNHMVVVAVQTERQAEVQLRRRRIPEG